MKPEDVTTSPWGRGTCPVCNREFNLLKNGKVHHHGDKDPNVWPPRRCDGTGDWPKVTP